MCFYKEKNTIKSVYSNHQTKYNYPQKASQIISNLYNLVYVKTFIANNNNYTLLTEKFK